MTQKPAPPSIDPADEGDFNGAITQLFDKFLQGVEGVLPARVISYNRTTNRATLQPLIAVLTTTGAGVQRATLASVPVFQYGGGGFLLSFPLKAGDLGWIVANDRDISTFLQSYSASTPNTVRKCKFSDAVFYPDAMKDFTIAGTDTDNAVFQNLSGSVKVSLGTSKLTIAAPNIEMLSTTLTHNGINIGATHVHPQDADSAGNAQPNTGAPQ